MSKKKKPCKTEELTKNERISTIYSSMKEKLKVKVKI